MSPITLPVVTVQHDMLDVVSDVDSGLVAYEDIWVSCYKTDEPSVHGKVRLSLDDEDRSLVRLDAREGVEMTRAVEVCARSLCSVDANGTDAYSQELSRPVAFATQLHVLNSLFQRPMLSSPPRCTKIPNAPTQPR
jgi:hypothetical protein